MMAIYVFDEKNFIRFMRLVFACNLSFATTTNLVTNADCD